MSNYYTPNVPRQSLPPRPESNLYSQPTFRPPPQPSPEDVSQQQHQQPAQGSSFFQSNAMPPSQGFPVRDPPGAPFSFPQKDSSGNEYFSQARRHFQTSDQRPSSSSGIPAAPYPSYAAPQAPAPYALGPMNPSAALLGGSAPAPPGPVSNMDTSPRAMGMVASRPSPESPPDLSRPRAFSSTTALRATAKAQDPMIAELKRIRNKESSQRFRDRTKERQREKDQRLDYLETKVFELEGALAEASIIRDENKALRVRIGELETQVHGQPRTYFYES